MAKREYIEEIQDRKKRYLKSGTRWTQFRRRFEPLADLLLNLNQITEKDIKREMIRYSFICSIACIEGYFRLLIKDLIDKNKECMKNIKNIDDLKFDIQVVLAIHGKEVSIGEFVSHLIPLSTFEQLNKNISIITGLNFIEELKKIKMEGKNGKIRELPQDIVKYLKQCYDYRNIYCHELAPKKDAIKLLDFEAKRCTVAMYDFIFASEFFVIKDFFQQQPQGSI